MFLKRNIIVLWGLLFLASIYLICTTDRDSLLALFSGYCSAFISYIFIIRSTKPDNSPSAKSDFKLLLGIALLTYGIALVYPPLLSEDYFRFLWDGEVTAAGLNPFDTTPDQLYENGFAQGQTYLQELYNKITILSRRH